MISYADMFVCMSFYRTGSCYGNNMALCELYYTNNIIVMGTVI